MRIALLGSGNELVETGMSLLEAGHVITHIGPSPVGDHGMFFDLINQTNAKIVSNHIDLLNEGVNDILMCSYAPLISREELARATFYNIHFALLPKYRGYHGFIWSIINDEHEAGYTLHLVDEGIDSGPISHQGRIMVSDTDDVLSLREKITQLLRRDVGDIFKRIERGEKPIPQDHSLATYVTRRVPDDGEINWNWPSRRIFNLIRAVKPPYTPGAFTYYNNNKITIHKSHCLPNPEYFMTPGKVVGFENNSILVKCGDSILSIDEIECDGERYVPRQLINRVGAKFGK